VLILQIAKADLLATKRPHGSIPVALHQPRGNDQKSVPPSRRLEVAEVLSIAIVVVRFR
jgi:hypothetical protein